MLEDDSNNNNKKSNDEVRKFAEQIKKLLSSPENSQALEALAEGICHRLENDKDFEEEIGKMLTGLSEEGDLPKLQSQIILLIKRYLSKELALKKYAGAAIKFDEQQLAVHLAEMSGYLMQQRTSIIKSSLGDTADKNRYYNQSNQSRFDLKRLVKNFVIYEIYKALSPRRIAGETRRDNFIHNVIMGGIERAKHYTGGSAAEIASYSPNLIKKLEGVNKNFKKNGREI